MKIRLTRGFHRIEFDAAHGVRVGVVRLMGGRFMPMRALLGLVFQLCWFWGDVLSAAEPLSPAPQRVGLPPFNSQSVALAWDAQPRLWLLETLQGPKGLESRILILQEDPGFSPAFRLKVFAESLPVSTGFEWTGQGVILGAGSELMLLTDTNHDDRADAPASIVSGFGNPTAPGRLTSFTWGPDGWVYFLFEADAVSSLEIKLAGVSSPPRIGGGVLRYHPRRRALEVFAEGPRHPAALGFDAEGNLLILTRTRENLFCGLSGANFLPANTFPAPVEYRVPRLGALGDGPLHRYGAFALDLNPLGKAEAGGTSARLWFTNSPVPLAIQLERDGAGLRAWEVQQGGSKDGFRLAPNDRFAWGPDGARWIRRGDALFRVPAVALGAALTTAELSRVAPGEELELLQHPNQATRSWVRRRVAEASTRPGLQARLSELMARSTSSWGRLEACWALASLPDGSPAALMAAAVTSDAVLRAWAVRLLGERRQPAAEIFTALGARAKDRDAGVRREVAVALRWLVPNLPRAEAAPDASSAVTAWSAVMEGLLGACAGEADEVVRAAVWGAFEPFFAAQPSAALGVLRRAGDSSMALTGELMSRTVRRCFGARDSTAVERMLGFLEEISGESPQVCAAGLMGMMQGQKSSKMWTGHRGVKRLLNRLSTSANQELAGAAKQVDAFCGNPASQNAIIAKINDPKVSEPERLKAIRFSEAIPSEAARAALLQAIRNPQAESLQLPAMEVLRLIAQTEDMEKVVRGWSGLPNSVRGAAAEALVAKMEWIPVLLKGLEDGRIRALELPAPVIHGLQEHPNLKLRARALAALSQGGR